MENNSCDFESMSPSKWNRRAGTTKRTAIKRLKSELHTRCQCVIRIFPLPNECDTDITILWKMKSINFDGYEYKWSAVQESKILFNWIQSKLIDAMKMVGEHFQWKWKHFHKRVTHIHMHIVHKHFMRNRFDLNHFIELLMHLIPKYSK